MLIFYYVLGCIIGISFITGLILTILESRQNKNKKIISSLNSVQPLYSVSISDKQMSSVSSDKQVEIL